MAHIYINLPLNSIRKTYQAIVLQTNHCIAFLYFIFAMDTNLLLLVMLAFGAVAGKSNSNSIAKLASHDTQTN